MAVTLAAVACASTSSPDLARDRLAIGTWGGADAGILVGDTLAHVHVGCTNGDFPTPVKLDADGRLDVTSQYQPRAFPVSRGPDVPARLTGQVTGDRLVFQVIVDDTVTHRVFTLGPRTVRYGREPGMAICPICRDASMPRTVMAWLAVADALPRTVSR